MVEYLKIKISGGNFYRNLEIVKSCKNRHYNQKEKLWLVPATKENLTILLEIPSIRPIAAKKLEDLEIDIEREILRATVTPEEAYKLKEDYPFLFNYQCVAAHFILDRKKYLVADEVGLGKTVQCMPFIDQMVRDGKRVIILCPTSISHQWASEINRFISLPSTNIVGMLKNKRLTEYRKGGSIIITTYESFKNDLSALKELQYDFTNVCVIADEASKFKNSKTRVYKELRAVSNQFHAFIALTGTPIENELRNFFNIVSIIDPSFMSLREFETNYCTYSGTGVYKKCDGYKNLKDFIHRITNIMIRRTKKDVTELPPIQTQNRIIPMTKEQWMCTEAIRKYKRDTDNMGCITLLREVANDTSLLNGVTSMVVQDMIVKKYLPPTIPRSSNKIPECLDIIQEIGDEQVIIFTQFAQMAQRLGVELLKKGYKIKILTGQTSNTEERMKEVERFKNGEFQILIATDIFGYGVNLQFCHYMINFDIPWNPAKLEQRKGRIHRQGSDRTKTVINLLSEEIDEHVYEVLEGKQNLFDQVVEGKAIDDDAIRKQILQKLVE
jgi:SNF2 family DNA or RNA helicase